MRREGKKEICQKEVYICMGLDRSGGIKNGSCTSKIHNCVCVCEREREREGEREREREGGREGGREVGR